MFKKREDPLPEIILLVHVGCQNHPSYPVCLPLIWQTGDILVEFISSKIVESIEVGTEEARGVVRSFKIVQLAMYMLPILVRMGDSTMPSIGNLQSVSNHPYKQ